MYSPSVLTRRSVHSWTTRGVAAAASSAAIPTNHAWNSASTRHIATRAPVLSPSPPPSTPTADAAAASAAAAADAAAEFSSPSTANTFRNFVRTRSATLAAKAKAESAVVDAGGKREWRDSMHMRALKQEAQGGVIRHTRARIQPGRLEEFLAWAQENLAKAYPHPAFKGAYLTVNKEENTVENLTFWKSELAVDQNGHLPIYRSTMLELAEFCIGVPDVDLKPVAIEIKGPIEQVVDEETIQDATRKNPPPTPMTRENASGIDYS